MPHRPETPPDEDDGVTVLQEEVGELLEKARLPQPYIDCIIHLIAMAEREAFLLSHEPQP